MMTNVQTRLCALAALTVLAASALAGCGKSHDAEVKSTPGAVVASAAAAQSNAVSTPDGNTLRLQGTMQVDAGQGEQALQSHATVVDAKLGEKTAARLGTAQGQKSLADANARVGGRGGPVATSSDVQDMANAMAGRTVYSSQASHIAVIHSYGIALDAKSASKPGPRAQLSLRFSDKDMSLVDGKVEFYPDSSRSSESYVTKIKASDVTIDKLERKDDNTFALSGSFRATDLKAGVLAKQLKGKTLASVSGRFDFQEVPIRGQ